MLINAVQAQECRIAIVKGGNLEELYIERTSAASQLGNIYKARVTNVEPSIQAAFVDFGAQKNGFLHVSDLHPDYFPDSKDKAEAVGHKRPRRQRPPIQKCLKRGQEVVVQMTKEGIGTKGPTMTTYLSIPGRMLVMMPGMRRLGVSRKIEDDDTRVKARKALEDLNLPSEMGFIVRTAGVGRSKRELQRDLNYLVRLWKAVDERIKTSNTPAVIHGESDLVIRTIRDVYDTDIRRIICDEEAVARRVHEFLTMIAPRSKTKVELYTGRQGLFHDSGLDDEIEKVYARKVELPSGGSLVIDQTEALVAIDVNSGRFRKHSDAETTALKTDLEATDEIVRQLKLRDMGGVIIIDYIDLAHDKKRRQVEKALRDALKSDRAKSKTSRMSNFGIVEMTRQRVRPSLERSVYRRCSHCEGSGRIKSEESQALQVMRALQRAASDEKVATIEVAVTPSVAHHLANDERRRLAELEEAAAKTIRIRADENLPGSEVRMTCTNARGAEVALEAAPSTKGGKDKLSTRNVQEILDAEAGEGKKRPRRKRSRRKKKAADADSANESKSDNSGNATDAKADKERKDTKDAKDDGGSSASKKKKTRRGRRGGRKHRRKKKSDDTSTKAQDGDKNSDDGGKSS
ncbi:MAG: Rne/Rng family ribonuclease [Phycisphaerae bacterium]|nr:Rne/Rng family ribonuclease [Phycisphaerae bacterium]